MQALCVLFCFCFDYLYHYFDCCFFSLYSVYVMHTICMGGWVGCSVRCCFHIAMRGITSYNNYNNLIIICIIIHYNNLIIIRFSNYFFQLCPRHIPHISILCVCICTWKNNKQTKEEKKKAVIARFVCQYTTTAVIARFVCHVYYESRNCKVCLSSILRKLYLPGLFVKCTTKSVIARFVCLLIRML